MSELNIELLKQVRDKIATTPQAYNQETWGQPSAAAPCGTAACIAGWACILSGAMTPEKLYDLGETRHWERIEGVAQDKLGLTLDEADTLFNGEPEIKWPGAFADLWIDSYGDQLQQAQVAVEYLDHIIETGKVLE